MFRARKYVRDCIPTLRTYWIIVGKLHWTAAVFPCIVSYYIVLTKYHAKMRHYPKNSVFARGMEPAAA